MAHKSEGGLPLVLRRRRILACNQLTTTSTPTPQVYLLAFPCGRSRIDARISETIIELIKRFCTGVHQDSTVCILTSPTDAAGLIVSLQHALEFRHWIVVKTQSKRLQSKASLPKRHSALLVFTRYSGKLKHAKTRIKYRYCQACGKTTKDYGGKRHLHHEYGTLISDVWRDIEWSPRAGLSIITTRLRDLFGVHPYRELRVLDLTKCVELQQGRRSLVPKTKLGRPKNNRHFRSRLVNGDCLAILKKLPTNSLDFAFADLPYNLGKKYYRWNDDVDVEKYFEWCNAWLFELSRVLKPGRTLAVLNIPVWAAQHYSYLSSAMVFQDWIVWDALSFPVRQIMPAHYGIVCFSKGHARPLPGLSKIQSSKHTLYVSARNEELCNRIGCVTSRSATGINEKFSLSDLWYDVHRLMHNSRRVSHPCQLPPLLMRRLFALFTKPGELIVDCFNGAGTSTLVAQEMGRRYLGIEISKRFHNLAVRRHQDLSRGINPFDKTARIPKVKNSNIERVPEQDYKVSKKALQLEAKRIAVKVGRLPTREDLITHSSHPIEYYSEYFRNWSEVCAAARLAVGDEIRAGTT